MFCFAFQESSVETERGKEVYSVYKFIVLDMKGSGWIILKIKLKIVQMV